MKNLKKLFKVIPLVFFIFISNFYYETEAKPGSHSYSHSRSSSHRSSSSSSRSSSSKSFSSGSNSSRSFSSSSSSSKSSSSFGSSSSKAPSSSSSSSKSSSSFGSSSSKAPSSSSSSKSSSSSSSSSSKAPSSSSSSSKSSSSFSSSSSSKSSESKTNEKSNGRSNLDIDNNKNYVPKESKNLKNQKINGKSFKSNDIEDVFEGKGINPSASKKYYYPTTYRRSILDNPFVRYYLVYNAIDDTIDMVTNRNKYKEEQIIGVVSNENGKDDIILFEENKKHNNIFNIKNMFILFVGIIFLWVFISYKKIFSKK